MQIIGLRRVEEAALLEAIGLHEGEVLTDWKIQRDMACKMMTQLLLHNIL